MNFKRYFEETPSFVEYVKNQKQTLYMPFLGTNGLYLMDYTMDEVYKSPDKQLEMALKLDEIVQGDFVSTLDDGNIFCEVLGAPMKKSEKDFYMVVDHPITNLIKLESLSLPNPDQTPRMKTNMESYQLLQRSQRKPVYLSVQGPFTLAVQLCGAEHLLKSTIKNPAYVEAVLDFTTETVRQYILSAEKAGADYISIAEPSTIMLSPKQFEAMIVPRLQRIYKSMTCWKGMHICGDTKKILDLMLETGTEAVSFDQIMDLGEIRKKIPNDRVVIGNLDPIQVLGKGSYDQVEKATRELLEQMKGDDRFVLAYGCTCLNDTPWSNFSAVLAGLASVTNRNV